MGTMHHNATDPSHRLATFTRVDLIIATALVGLVASTLVAIQRPVAGWELAATDWVVNSPDALANTTYPIMQLGTLGGPIVVALAIGVIGRDWALSAATVTAGIATWWGAKGVKRLVERGRPLEFMSDLVVREGDGSGLGYVSGHSAVAACTAIMAMVALPRRWRPAAVALAVVVGIARIIHGVHFPADVVGGWSFGVLIAIGALALLDLIERRGDRT